VTDTPTGRSNFLDEPQAGTKLTEAGRSQLLDWYQRMVLIREVEQRLSAVAKTGDLPGPIHVSIGQEAVAVGITAHLCQGDWVASTHRGHGHFLALGGDPRQLVAEIYGRSTGVCQGKGGSMHVADFSRGIIGANGIVGAGIGLAVGAALTCQIAGAGNVAVAFFGDGGANQGLLFEALNLAAVWKLPLILSCENNGWSEFTSSSALTAGVIAERAAPFGIPHFRINGNDVIEVAAAASAGIQRARQGEGPTLIEACTYRTHGHVEAEATFLPRGYREESEIDEWRSRDPIVHAARLLHAAGAGADIKRADRAVADEVSAAFAFAEESPDPDLSDATSDVFACEETAR
jgi:acetoin:2,6-dichlorophenolindophenol oxidoreductase subunit alpha